MIEPRPSKNPNRVPAPFLAMPTAIDRPRFVVGAVNVRSMGVTVMGKGEKAVGMLTVAGLYEITEGGVYVDPNTGAHVYLARGAQVGVGADGKPWEKVASEGEYIETIEPAPAVVTADDVREVEARMVAEAPENESARSAGNREDRVNRSARSRAVRSTQEGRDKEASEPVGEIGVAGAVERAGAEAK